MAKTRIKRRHTEEHPEVYATQNGKIRNEILSHLYTHEDGCPMEKHFEFTKTLQGKLNLSYDPKDWHKRFTKYVSEKNRPDGLVLVLTRLGRNLVNIVING